jgi:hypothetical protein
VVVGFVVATGGGSVSPASATTDAQGIARTQWVLGTNLSLPQTLYAEARAGVATNFTATAQVTPTAVLTRISGDGQTVVASTPITLVAELRQHGVPIQGAQVAFYGQTSGYTTVATTDAQGRATGTTAAMKTVGVEQVAARVIWRGSYVVGPVATFTITTMPGAVAGVGIFPYALTLDAGTVLPVTVGVSDKDYNRIPGTQVQISVTGGTAPSVVTMGANGTATFDWTLPTSPTPSVQKLSASAGGLTATAEFSMTSGPAASLVVSPHAVTVAPNAEAIFGVTLYDVYGNEVRQRHPGCTVVWTAPPPATVRPLLVTGSASVRVTSSQSIPVTATCGSASDTAQYVVQ